MPSRWKPDSSPVGRAGRAEAGSAPTPPDAYQKALGLLVRREHSRTELRRKLVAKGADHADTEQALDTLAGQGFQNDERYAQAFARTRAAAGYGPQRIRAELSMHRLSSEQVRAALEACDTDWAALAGGLAARRFRASALVDPAQRRKAIDFLLRRGFEQSHAIAAVRAAASGRGDETSDLMGLDPDALD